MVSKQRLVALHRWVALGAGIFLAAMGLTGATLVYKEEIEARVHPERLVPEAPPRYEAVLATARAAAPAARTYTIHTLTPGHAFRVDASGADYRRLRIDPRDGHLISAGSVTDDWLDLVERLHTHFLGGEAGEVAVAIVGIFLAALAITGLVQGWPRRLRDAMRVRWGAPSPWLAYDLHRVAGLALALLLLAQAVTGVAMVFSKPTARFVNRLVGSSWPADPALHAPAPAPRASLDDVVHAAERAMPGTRVSRIVVKSGDAPIAVRLHASSDHHPAGLGSVLVDPYDAKVLQVAPLASLSTGQRMYDWIFPLHVGHLFGAPHRALQVAVGTSLPLLLASGLMLWAKRRRRRPKRT